MKGKIKPLSDFHFVEGEVLLFDKPIKWTSFDVVNKVRWLITDRLKKTASLPTAGKRQKIKVGHAGTLDPLASGLLIICSGKMTKSINEFQNQEKEYTGTIRLDGITPSYDLETEVSDTFDISHLTKDKILHAVESFKGLIRQMPPAFSAKSKDGVRAYVLARKGIETQLEAVEVSVSEFEITSFELIDTKSIGFRIVCSKGTYIRSLAYDLGKVLGCGGYLTSLCRTRIGTHSIENAIKLEEFIEMMKKEDS